MDTKYEFKNSPEPADEHDKIVYVRPVRAKDLPHELRAQVGGLKRLFALHNSDGEQLALVKDERLAFVLARQHDLSPVRVH